MMTKAIPRLGSFDAWREAARELLAAGIPPDQITWNDEDTQPALFDETARSTPAPGRTVTVPKHFLDLARKVIAHRDVERFSWAYKMLWRLQADPSLLSNPADPGVHHLHAMAKSVSRDCHKMKAFVRFRELEKKGERRVFAAWFEPDHHIVELTGPFFANRFADMDWLISTPDAVALFADGQLTYAPPDGSRHAVTDDMENLWRTYYSNIFNPARLKIKAMESEMPRKYWKNLPEATLIPELIASAGARTQKMRAQMPSQPPARLAKIKAPTVNHPDETSNTFTSLEDLRAAAKQCTRCPLHCHATQTVFGEGPANARIMIVGEQPGDLEDIAGKPFIGPAGRVFDDAIAAAGIDRSDFYVTNSVKHFKFTTLGKRRIHERPNRSEIQHCKWWLDRELSIVKPQLVVGMGTTALYALTGRGDSIMSIRGQFQQLPDGTRLLPTIHPSAILRNPTEGESLRRAFYSDVASLIAK
jgi:uracil-DNA glycosylase